jgi:hypothetical protein
VVAANASARGQRVAILASPLHELTELLHHGRLPGARLQRGAQLCHRGAGELLRPRHGGGSGVSADALLQWLRRARLGSTGDQSKAVGEGGIPLAVMVPEHVDRGDVPRCADQCADGGVAQWHYPHGSLDAKPPSAASAYPRTTC